MSGRWAAVISLLIALATPAQAEDGAWDPTLPPTISAGAPATRWPWPTSRCRPPPRPPQTMLGLGQQFLSGLGINLGGKPAGTSASGIPRATAGRPSSTDAAFLADGCADIGGGGTPNSPSRASTGANVVGFDLAASGRGIAGGRSPPRIPHQYSAGCHGLAGQAGRPDLLRARPGQHVTIYLGNDAGGIRHAGKVTISPARKGGMTLFF